VSREFKYFDRDGYKQSIHKLVTLESKDLRLDCTDVNATDASNFLRFQNGDPITPDNVALASSIIVSSATGAYEYGLTEFSEAVIQLRVGENSWRSLKSMSESIVRMAERATNLADVLSEEVTEEL
jgi:hypothetical protein